MELPASHQATVGPGVALHLCGIIVMVVRNDRCGHIGANEEILTSCVLHRGGAFHASQDLKSTALQVGLRAGGCRGGQPLHRPAVLLLFLVILLLLLHHYLGHTLKTASSFFEQHHVKVPEVAAVFLGFHPLHKLGIEAEVVSDAVLPTVVGGGEEGEVGAGKT